MLSKKILRAASAVGTLFVVSTFSACSGGGDDQDAHVLNGTGALKDTAANDLERKRLDDLAQQERDAAASRGLREQIAEAEKARRAAAAAEEARLADEAAERKRHADAAERQQRFESAVDGLNKRAARLISALSEDAIAGHETGDLGVRMAVARDGTQKILSAAGEKDASQDDALLRRMIEAQRHVDRLLAERSQWLAKEPARRAAREAAARLRRAQEAEAALRDKAAREAADRLRQDQQDHAAREQADRERAEQERAEQAREAQEQEDRDARDAADRSRNRVPGQEPDICNPSDVTTMVSAGPDPDPASGVTHITVTLKTAGLDQIAEGDGSRVNAALQRALRMHAKGAGARYTGGPLLLSRAIDRQAVKIDRFLPDGSALVRLGQRVSRDEVGRLLAHIRRDATVRAADPDTAMVPHHLATNAEGSDSTDDSRWHVKRIKADKAAARLSDDVARKTVATAVVDSGWVRHASLEASQYRGGVNFSALRENAPTAEETYTFSFPFPPGKISAEDLYHGTSVAGFIGASAGTRKSAPTVQGVNPGSRLLPVKMGLLEGSTRHGMASDMSEAIYWIAGKSVLPYAPHRLAVRVINISLGRPTDWRFSRHLAACPAPLQNAIDYANEKGITIVTSAGNNDSPASWSVPGNCDGVITVGGTNSRDRRFHISGRQYAGSAYGKAVTISAPGENVWAINVRSNRLPNDNPATRRPVTGGEYEIKVSGTSFAAPQVAGVVTLMLAANPALRPAQIKTILMETADRKMQYLPFCERPPGAGIVDAEAAVKRAQEMAAG